MEIKSLSFTNLYQLLQDAAEAACLAAEQEDRKQCTSNGLLSRASVISSALALECAAYQALDRVSVSRKLATRLEKLPTLEKFEIVLQISKPTARFDRSRAVVLAATELVKIRNDLVHPKTRIAQASPDGGSLDFGRYSHLQIPQLPLLYRSLHAGVALRTVADFFHYFFKNLLGWDANTFGPLLMPPPTCDPPMTTPYAQSDPYLVAAAKRWNFPMDLICPGASSDLS